MRMTILIGLILVTLGGATLYQIRNGFFMYLVGHTTHWPPTEPEAINAEFDELAKTESESPGITLGDVARARVECAEAFTGAPVKANAGEGFRRLNLIILGVGVNSPSPMIEPNARRLTELRPDLTRDARDWIEPALNERETASLRKVLELLLTDENLIYRGVDLNRDFGHLDFERYANALLNGGAPYYDCVRERRY